MTSPTKKQRERWEKLRQMGCCICGANDVEIHHAFTGAGGRKNHDLVLNLCAEHHRGKTGLHGMGRKAFTRTYGTEQELLDKSQKMLHEF